MLDFFDTEEKATWQLREVMLDIFPETIRELPISDLNKIILADDIWAALARRGLTVEICHRRFLILAIHNECGSACGVGCVRRKA